jgi:GNAT superfamily N-acetyltransferase
LIRIRKASLLDYQDIWQVHASDIDEWVNDQGQVDQAAFGRSSIAERWLKGGPWMSPETCAIHLNALLLAEQTPLVACKGNQVLGEIELWLGADAAFPGPTLNISVFYVHRAARGQGVGSALLRETLRRARVFGCRAVTVYHPSADAEALYRRFGLQETYEQRLLLLPTGERKTDIELRQIDWPRQHQPLADLELWMGSYQSSYQTWQQIVWALKPGLYALPLRPVTRQMTWRAESKQGGEAYLCLRPLGNGEQAQVHIWSQEVDLNLVAALLPVARDLGIRQLQLMCGENTATKLRQQFGGVLQPGHKRLALRLPGGPK